ncbi:hypothetical protein H1235_15550 [Pseudoxanthomonas sp. NC8]|nr:hypothetical protein H1235_15550 [Pseudoxanthomonas sp. NC8]
MSGLALTRAPPAPRPLRFLLTVPVWGVLAGVLLAASPDALAGGRWAPAAVALVHMFTLGVLGNAMLGSLLQFLPVAAATPLPGARLVPLAHAALNLGLGLFVFALYRDPALLVHASCLLVVALLCVVLPPLPGLLRAGALRLLRGGIGAALAALLGTLVLGLLAAAVLGGHVALPLDRLVDAHAALGVGGWMLGLLAAVGSVTVPMLGHVVAAPARLRRVAGLHRPVAVRRRRRAPAGCACTGAGTGPGPAGAGLRRCAAVAAPARPTPAQSVAGALLACRQPRPCRGRRRRRGRGHGRTDGDAGRRARAGYRRAAAGQRHAAGDRRLHHLDRIARPVSARRAHPRGGTAGRRRGEACGAVCALAAAVLLLAALGAARAGAGGRHRDGARLRHQRRLPAALPAACA